MKTESGKPVAKKWYKVIIHHDFYIYKCIKNSFYRPMIQPQSLPARTTLHINVDREELLSTWNEKYVNCPSCIRMTVISHAKDTMK